MTYLIQQLEIIDSLLEQTLKSTECRELTESHYYNPDVTLVDALFGIRQAIFCEQLRQESLIKNAPSLAQ